MQTIKNALSYLWYVFSLDWFQLVSTIIDVFVLVWSVVNWREIVLQPSFLLLFVGVLVNFVWQIFNVSQHFKFLVREDPKKSLMSLLEDENKKKDFTRIKVKEELARLRMPYSVSSTNEVLENQAISALLRDTDKPIIPVLSKTKEKETRMYVRQYKETLLKFLNQKWYDISKNRGQFTNDKKVCLGSEIFVDGGTYKWRIAKGCYYNGYLTNTLFSQYVGGNHYVLYPPMNVNNTAIGALGSSDFSDHIGVSTLLYNTDGYVVVFQQAGNAGQYANRYMPSGSGSLDFSDYHSGEDVRSMIIRGAERELGEESLLTKHLSVKSRNKEGIRIETKVLSFYRDLERGGKPEFCCVSMVNKEKDYIMEYISADTKELANDKLWVELADEKAWQALIPKASLSLRMNYQALINSLKV